MSNKDTVTYVFAIHISPCGDSECEYEITEEEEELINRCIEDEISFQDCEELSDLYDRVMDAARAVLREELDNYGNENGLDADDLDYCVDF